MGGADVQCVGRGWATEKDSAKKDPLIGSSGPLNVGKTTALIDAQQEAVRQAVKWGSGIKR